MTFRCPACSAPVTLPQTESAPRPHVIYRCTVCRLHLVLDSSGTTMDVPPLVESAADRRPKRRA